MCVCVCVCVCVCFSVRMCMCVCVCLSIHASMYISEYGTVFTHTLEHFLIHLYMHNIVYLNNVSLLFQQAAFAECSDHKNQQ